MFVCETPLVGRHQDCKKDVLAISWLKIIATMKKYSLGLFFLVSIIGFQSTAQGVLENKPSKDLAFKALEAKRDRYSQAAVEIWDYAELGYLEQKSSDLLQNILTDNEFTVDTGVAGIPTAFVASYGEGKPVIAILAEYDALPGFSQTNAPKRESIPGSTTGHACGHHLFGVGSVAAAVELKDLIKRETLSGT